MSAAPDPSRPNRWVPDQSDEGGANILRNSQPLGWSGLRILLDVAMRPHGRLMERLPNQLSSWVMPHKFPPAYALTTRPCSLHAGRHRWVITGNGMPIQTSPESFATPREAHADGHGELEKLIKTSRTSWVRPYLKA